MHSGVPYFATSLAELPAAQHTLPASHVQLAQYMDQHAIRQLLESSDWSFRSRAFQRSLHVRPAGQIDERRRSSSAAGGGAGALAGIVAPRLKAPARRASAPLGRCRLAKRTHGQRLVPWRAAKRWQQEVQRAPYLDVEQQSPLGTCRVQARWAAPRCRRRAWSTQHCVPCRLMLCVVTARLLRHSGGVCSSRHWRVACV